MSAGNGHNLVGPSGHDVSLVTGFPNFTARRLIERLLARTADDRVYLLVRDKFKKDAVAFQALLPQSSRSRLSIIEGDVADMDLGLPGPDYKALAAELTAIHHTAAVYYLGAKRELVERVNVDGTRTMLDLAADCTRLRRFVHWSTSQVSGARSGVILEEELDCGQRFRNICEETKFRAERMVRDAARRLPVTILRPGIIVGDSKSGEIDKFDGPYYLLVLIVSSPIDVHLPLPGRGSAPLNLVPIDFVVRASHAIGRDPRAPGRTFHLVDPTPVNAKRVFDLVARAGGRPSPRGFIPTNLTKALLRTPGLERFAKSPRAFIERLATPVRFDARNADAILAGAGITCPPFESYVDQIVEYVRDRVREKRERRDVEAVREEEPDPLEGR
jgi:thioester reductase-like protein